MPSIEIKNFAKDADEVATPNNARVETVNVAGQRVMKLLCSLVGNGLKTLNQWLEQKAVRQSTLV